MVYSSRYVQIGDSDCGNIYLKRSGESIILKRFTALDYADMEEYIRESHDTLEEWQSAAYYGHTELSYEEWMQDYNYDYGDYYDYDSDIDEYYDGSSSDTMDYHRGIFNYNYSKDELIDRIMNDFNDDFDVDNFEYIDGFNDIRLREKIGEYYDECVTYRQEREEASKPHWQVFNYYK